MSNLKTNERPSRRGFLSYALLVFLTTAVAVLCSACPTGTQTSVGLTGSVSVDPKNCKEVVPDGGASASLAVLNCTSGTVGGTVQITFPRKEWSEIVGVTPPDAGPGK